MCHLAHISNYCRCKTRHFVIPTELLFSDLKRFGLLSTTFPKKKKYKKDIDLSCVAYSQSSFHLKKKVWLNIKFCTDIQCLLKDFKEYSCDSMLRNVLKSVSRRHRNPVIQILASSGLFAIRSNTIKVSP